MSLDWAGSLGALWAREADRTDGVLGPLGDALLGLHPPESLPKPANSGRRVADLGCGAGQWIRKIAGRLTPADLATGIDVSAPLLEAARSGGAPASAAPIEWVLADAASHNFGHQPLDAVYSRCGCMFFDDPAGAFAHLRGAMRPGGGFYAAVWGSPLDNPWATAPLGFAADVLGADLAAPPPENAPGPFAWSSPETFTPILTAAGFQNLEVQPSDASCVIGALGAPDPVEEAVEASFTTGPLASRCRTLAPDQIEAVRTRLRVAYRAHVSDGAVRLPGRGWLISAKA